ncbi:MAG: alpha/beta fold hydrolase [Gemmatimonadota bacterium]|jgi:dipeptidyl aminopeptidase/acylaminoacyl peptidase
MSPLERTGSLPRRATVVPAILLLATVAGPPAAAQSPDRTDEIIERLERQNERLSQELDVISRQVDDLMFFHRLGDIADIDKVRLTGPPLRYEPNPTAQGAGNPFRFYAYVFIPKDLDRSREQPLIVFPHGGVHSNFSTGATNVLREMLQQGYTVVAPEYRGSTGYGGGTYRAIDYGGLEVEDTYAAMRFMLDTYDFLDGDRVGIVGWSHGGLHALMNIFEHGDAYAAAYAGVPVSDLIARMGYKTEGYRDLYSADYHIGKTAYEDVEEYRRRSPSWQTDRYDGTPLLIHTNTNDEDVNVLEVERLIQALQASGKTGFEYRIYQDQPGGHSFNRLDTPAAVQSRREIWRFLAPHLRPDRPIG